MFIFLLFNFNLYSIINIYKKLKETYLKKSNKKINYENIFIFKIMTF